MILVKICHLDFKTDTSNLLNYSNVKVLIYNFVKVKYMEDI